jgi:glycosyltransferase involved in cell wall biosynthesis
MLRVSVIIPVYNDVAGLTRCLTALARQTLPRKSFEVIVVDNGGTTDLSPALSALPGVVLLVESSPGSYAARNCGVKHAKGPIIAFTDSDCTPEENWLQNALAHLSDARDAILGGRIDVYARDPDHPTFAEHYDLALAFPQRHYVEVQGYSVTANLIVPRRVLDHAGPFDAQLKSGGDKEWCQRAVGKGFSLRYADDVVVAHPARTTVAELVSKRQRQVGGVLDKALRRYPKPVAYARVLSKECTPPVARLIRMRVDADKPLMSRAYRTWVVLAVSSALQFGACVELVNRAIGHESKR